MNYDPIKHKRRSIRLKGYDYSQEGMYHVVLRTKNGVCVFGEVKDNRTNLSQFGEIVERCWMEIPERFRNVELDQYVVMPNHIHGIILIKAPVNALVGAIQESPIRGTLATSEESPIREDSRAPEESTIRRTTTASEESTIPEGPVASGEPPIQGSSASSGEPHIPERSPGLGGSLKPETLLARRRMLIPMIVGRFKMKSAKEINELQWTSGKPFWHRGYYEHIIRDGRDLDRIRKYILENPLNWDSDDEHPRNIRVDSMHDRAENWSALD